MSKSSPPGQQRLIPLESLILEGFSSRFQQVFDCPCLWTNQNDKTIITQQLFGQGRALTYPYAWFTLQSMSHNVETYNTHVMGRRGLVMGVLAEDQYQTVKVMPVNFEAEVHYVTNRFEGSVQGSVTAFASRWLLARRFGYLKTSVQYGNLKFGISTLLNETVQIPQRENILEAETKYEVTVGLTIHGYISEPVTSQVGKINKVNLDSGAQIPNGKVVSMQTLTFDSNQDQPQVPTGRNLRRVKKVGQ